jgi:cytochrome c oxidase subunit II
MSRRVTRTKWPAVLGLLAAAVSGPAWASNYAFNMPVGVTEISSRVYDLHMLIFWICVIIGAVVFGAMFLFHLQPPQVQGRAGGQVP